MELLLPVLKLLLLPVKALFSVPLQPGKQALVHVPRTCRRCRFQHPVQLMAFRLDCPKGIRQARVEMNLMMLFRFNLHLPSLLDQSQHLTHNPVLPCILRLNRLR